MTRDELMGKIRSELEGDRRVMAAWLAGSLGRGSGDDYSDVDVWVVVADDRRDELIGDWPRIAGRIADTVLVQRVGARRMAVFNHVTTDWDRFDVTIGSPHDVPRRSRGTVKLMFDRAGLDRRLRPAGDPLPPSPDRVTALVTEFLRVLGLLPVVMGRQEYVVAQSGACLLRTMLIQLMVEDVAVEDRGGALHLKRLLPPERLRVLEELPGLEPTQESALAAHLACARAFLPLARDIADRSGVEWPVRLEEATRARLSRALSIEIG